MAGEAQLEALFAAITTRLKADATIMQLAPGGVHLHRAPQGAGAPAKGSVFVVVTDRPGGRIGGTLGRARSLRTVNLEIVAWAPGVANTSGLRLDERFEGLFADAVLSLVSPWTASGVRRLVDVTRPAIHAGEEYEARGGLYRVALSGWSA